MTQRKIATQLTVVVPTLGRETLRRTVQSIAAGTMIPAEVVLSHQGAAGSIDALLAQLRQLEVPLSYVHSSKRGYAAGRNTGIACVKTRFLATTDDDCVVDPQWVEQLVGALELNPREIVTGRVLASEPSEVGHLFRKASLAGDHFTGGNFGIALDVFRDVGPFDETGLIGFSEDNEWLCRAFKKGYCARFIPNVAMTHLHWRDEEAMEPVYAKYAWAQDGWYGRKLRERDLSVIVRTAYEVLRGWKRWVVRSVTRDVLRKANGRPCIRREPVAGSRGGME